MAFSEELAQRTGEEFLRNLRHLVSRLSLNESRLPGWIKAAKVRVGWVNYSLVLAIEDSVQNDSYTIKGPVDTDTAILLDTENFSPQVAVLQASSGENLIIMVGHVGDEGGSIVSITGPPSTFFDCGYAGYHGPRALSNLFLRRMRSTSAEVAAMRFVPFALYVHESDVIELDWLWRRCEPILTDWLNGLNSQFGDFYARRFRRSETFALTKKTGVVVLGKDTGEELQELTQVRDYFRGRGYSAELIKDLPEIPMMSNEEKVRLWALASRFCVMVDRVPAGHIAEFAMLREQRTILALLRPRGYGSTYMIGDDSLVDRNYIKVFEFDSTVFTVLDDVIDWAEAFALERMGAYNEAYPWR